MAEIHEGPWSNIRIECPDGIASSTQITDAQTGSPIRGVTKVDFSLTAREPARAVLEIEGLVFVYEGRAELAGEVMDLVKWLRGYAEDFAAVRPEDLERCADRLEAMLGRAVGITRNPTAVDSPQP